MTTRSENKMRTAVAKRDRDLDGVFVYAVITTGIFCRPSCPSRPARSENLRFFDDHQAATAAGFRACKRCDPMAAATDLANLIESARYIETHADQKLTLTILAQRAGLSMSHYQRAFKAAIGVSPKAFQDAARLQTLKNAWQSGDDISGAIYSAGYGSASRVYGRAVNNTGMTPSAYRKGGAGEKIFHACCKTRLGFLTMGATERGVCFAQFGDSETALISQLEAEFPNAEVVPSSANQGAELRDWISALNNHLEQNKPRPDLPLDLQGTAFQIKVWRFLLSIPDGDVISYGELAAGINKPKAFRAAATACGKNRIAVLVPCHRVLRGNGDLGGYRWGLERKRALLDSERQRRAAQRNEKPA